MAVPSIVSPPMLRRVTTPSPGAGSSGGPREVSAAAARRFLVTRHLLAPPRSLPRGREGVLAAVERLGSVQFDPLGVAGRNHDLVLHARVRDYERSWTDALLYEERALFETVNKQLCLLPTSELPWYRHAWDRSALQHEDGAFMRHRETVEHILELIRARGPMSSLDFERRASVDWYWGPTNEVRATLEALWEAGILGLARRAGNLRHYDLMERLFPPELLRRRPSAREQVRHKLLSRYRAVGLLGTGGDATLWYGTGKGRLEPGDPADVVLRSDLRRELVESGDLAPIVVEGVRGTRYVLSQELGLLDAAAIAIQGPMPDPGVTFLAPLDSLAWDRDLLRQLFDFDYVWEVYVPAHRRRWGYYVLPVLFGDRFVGRIEPRIDQAAGVVRVLGAWWEAGVDPRREDGLVDAMREALAAYLRFARARRLEWAPGLARERRLFGVRPSPAPARAREGRPPPA
jgi:uncharacterized protein